MKLLLNSKEIGFGSREDLEKAIPEGMSGYVLNFGQGEGQVEIDSTVWGFYVNSEESYYMSFEEGLIEFREFERLVGAITNALSLRFGVPLNVSVEGSFSNGCTR
jgi:hypothetical protein